MHIRQATTADVAGIQRVARAAWTAAYESFLDSAEIDAAMEQWYARDRLRAAVSADDTGYFVADEGDDGDDGDDADADADADAADGVVGYASAGPADQAGEHVQSVGVGELYAIYVHPDRWGEGVGSRLLERAERYLDDSGMARVRAVVLADNEVGIDFYESRGFERVEERETDLLSGGVARAYVYHRAIE